MTAEGKREAVVFDLDGTLCDTSAIKHLVEGPEKDFWAFHQASADAPVDAQVREELLHQHEQGRRIVILTSREFIWRDLTLDWLVANSIPYDELLMRIVGDYRPDHVVKAELLDRVEKAGHSVVEAWEDRPDVAEVWQRRGIAVHMVG